METFKRIPTIRMLAAEVTATIVGLQSGQKDSYQPAIYLSPTDAKVNRVLIAGTAVEKEDVGTDNSFWRVKVADPTGVVFVSACQYQPEAAKAIQKLDVPCYVTVSGKLSHYKPEQGGETIVSVNASPAPAAPDPQPVPASTPAVTSPSPPAEIPKPATQPHPPVQEPVKAPAASEKPKRRSKKDGTKTAPLDQVKEVPTLSIPKEPVIEVPKADAKPSGLEDSEVMVLDILKTHKPQGALARDTIQNILRETLYEVGAGT